MGKLLAISILQYAEDVRTPEEYEKLLGESEVSKDELKLAKMLILATRMDEPELEEYHDLYNERLKELVEAIRASLQRRAKSAMGAASRKAAKPKSAAKKRRTG